MPNKVENVEVHISSMYYDDMIPRMVSLGWTRREADKEFRYHVWLRDPYTFAHEGVVYKNPPRAVKYKEPGYFDTRRLDAWASGNHAMITDAVSIAQRNDLMNKAIAAKRAELEAERAKTREEWRIRQIKEAGPLLLEALKKIDAALAAGESDPEGMAELLTEVSEIARSAINKLDADVISE